MKMFSLLNHQRKANQNYLEISPCLSQKWLRSKSKWWPMCVVFGGPPESRNLVRELVLGCPGRGADAVV